MKEQQEQPVTTENNKKESEGGIKSKEEILKEIYIHHTNVVNPDGNWATWEECKKDGTLQLAYDAMEAYASQFTASKEDWEYQAKALSAIKKGMEIALKDAMEECERLAGLVKFWQEKYYELNAPMKPGKIDNL